MFMRYRTVTRRVAVMSVALLSMMIFLYYMIPDKSGILRYTTSFNDNGLPNVIGLGIDSDDLNDANHPSGRKTAKATITGADKVCRIPTLKKDRPEISHLYKKAAPMKCAEKCGKSWLEIDDEGHIQPTEYVKVNIGEDKIACHWAFFERVGDNDLKVGEMTPMQLGEKVAQGDYFEAKCRTTESVQVFRKWRGLFMTATAKLDRVMQLKEAKRPKHWSGLNVYVLGFDSVSQMEFRRNMPKTVDYLENVMKTNVFNGFNIVGDGTPQAYIPFLTGQTEVELPLTRKRYSNANFVDDVYPFVWRNFSDAGYATLYGEDAHGIGTFTYRLKGFRKQPTDHFPATFFHRYENYCNERRSIAYDCCGRCVGEVPQHKMWLQYAESFWREYDELPRYLLMHHSGLSHDSMDDLQLADDDLRDHLQKMHESGAFDNTMVIVMADHGRRFSQMRETQQGQLEERLPFFSLYLPEELADKSPVFAEAIKNLRANAKDRLVSHFDMHATQMQLLQGWPTSEKEFVEPVKNPTARSLSLFNKIPANRTCENAGIEAHWCTCLQWQDALASGQTSLQTANMLAESVVRVFNNQTEPERTLCAPLKLSRLISAKMLTPDEKMLRYNGVTDVDGFVPRFGKKASTTVYIYQLVLETVPGNAKYEVTVNYDSGPANTVTVDLKSASHINAYGDQPHCIIDKNYFLAAYCVCYDKI